MLDLGMVSNGPCMRHRHLTTRLLTVLSRSENDGLRQEATQLQQLRNSVANQMSCAYDVHV